MKRKLMKNLLLVLVMIVLCLAVGMTASAESESDYLNLFNNGVLDKNNQTILKFNVNGGTISDSVMIYDFETKSYYSVSNFKETFYSVPSEANVGETNILPNVKAPFRYKFMGWYCYADNNTYSATDEFIVAEEYKGTIIEFVADYSLKAYIEPGDSGQCGSNTNCTLLEDGTLLIDGNGEVTMHFKGPHIKKVVISNGITELPSNLVTEATNLIAYYVDAENQYYSSDEYGVLFNKEKTVLIQYPFGNKNSSYSIPSGVKTIGTNAFSECYNLKSINISDSVSEIDDNALFGIDAVVDENNKIYSSDNNGVLFNKDKTVLIKYPSRNEEVSYYIPDSVTVIENSAFAYSVNLANVTLNKNTTEIGQLAFHYCFGLTEMVIPENVTNVGFGALLDVFLIDKITIKAMNVNIGEYLCCPAESGMYFSGISHEKFWPLMKRVFLTRDEEASSELIKYLVGEEGHPYLGTIYCHAGSTAETYAIENGVDYVLTHFFEGDWTYDYDNMIRYRKCIHCDELETESLETTTDSDVEIIEPADPDTDFVVDVITDYVVIEETISNNVAGDFEIVKAFDITMKNKDGVHVQPDGTVKVKLPLDWSKDGVYKVYRVNDDGTLTDMNAYREGSHMVFETDHFSVYVIVDESEKADEPTTPDEPQEETKKDFFSKIIDWFRSLIDLITSWFKK